MLIIRKEQMRIFELVALRRFEYELVRHIREFAPRPYKNIGEQNVYKIVKMGLQRAMEYGLTNRGPIRFFIEQMFMFGSYFDTDPQYSWTHKILDDHAISNQKERADSLYKKTMDYLDKAVGPDCKYEKDALQRIIQSGIEDLPTSEIQFESNMYKYMKAIYPEKSTYIGEQEIIALIQSGHIYANKNFITRYHGIALFIIFMFAFGHRCFEDLQFSWIQKILQNHSNSEHDKKIERLKSKIMIYFRHVHSELEKEKICH